MYKIIKEICKRRKEDFCMYGIKSVEDIEDCCKENCKVLNKIKESDYYVNKD